MVLNTVLRAGAALLVTTSLASAGGLDRSGQSVAVIFEEGDYAELSFGVVTPSLTGNMNLALGGAASGNIASSFSQFGLSYKTKLSDQLSLALIYDQPFGADVTYEEPGYLLSGAEASIDSTGLTAVLNYKLDKNFSVHAGARLVSASGIYSIPAIADLDGSGPLVASPAYASDYSRDSGLGYVAGASYSRPDIALRIALTYSSPIDLELDGTAGDLSTTLPASVNVDFQTGIAAGTLLFGSIRYTAWDGFALSDTLAGDILSYDEDVYTYSIGIGRRLSEKLSASFSMGYERDSGELSGNLGPTDGYISYQIGAAYIFENGVELSGGLSYVDLGDATTTGIRSSFKDNSATGFGIKVAYDY
jgi:long-subunit fatty acid transport protein